MKEYEEDAIKMLIPSHSYDECSQVNVEIRPGVGGSESSLFAQDIMGMFQNYANIMGWSCQVLQHQQDTQISKGCKFGLLQISGEECYYRLKCEAGVHKFTFLLSFILRVIRVPETENKGRLHSSTISVTVLPQGLEEEFSLSLRDVKFEYMRSSGPGGQHVNKTESACRVTHIATGLQVVCMDDRSQERNKQKALATLKDKLFALHVEEQQDKLTKARRSQVQGADRSDKIRTYNWPQQRITGGLSAIIYLDHRTNLTLYGIEKMLNGDLLDQFIDSYLQKIYNTKLEDLMEELQEKS